MSYKANVETTIAQVQYEMQRLHAKADLHQRRLSDLKDVISKLKDSVQELESMASSRRFWIEKRWAARRTVREIKCRMLELEPLRLPAKAGGLKQLVRTRTEELARRLQENAAEIPNAVCRSGVYALFNDGEIVYIGQAVNILSRVGQHVGSKIFTHAAFISVPVERLTQVERALLDVFTPRLNRDPATVFLRRKMSQGDHCQ